MNPSAGGILRALLEALRAAIAGASPADVVITAAALIVVIVAAILVIMWAFKRQTRTQRQDIIALIRAIRGK